MSRTRPFVLRVTVSDEFLRDDPPMARALARTALIDQSTSLTGPRGGRYEAVEEPHDFRADQSNDDFLRNVWSFTARVQARYVRPVRSEEPA